jgi:hypothetical protein
LISRTQLAAICKTLELKLQQLGFVLLDVQFDIAAEILSIVLDNEPQRKFLCSIQQNPTNGATIDARLLWDVLRDLLKLGVTSPAIQLRKANRSQLQIAQPSGRNDSRLV